MYHTNINRTNIPEYKISGLLFLNTNIWEKSNFDHFTIKRKDIKHVECNTY